MKKAIYNLLVLISIFSLSCVKKEKVMSSGQTVRRSIGPCDTYGPFFSNISENMLYPDAYPELDNMPPTRVTASYSPDEEHMIRLEFSNPSNFNSNGFFSPYFQLQYRKINALYGSNADSKWYNYHPTLQAYDSLRTETFNTQYHPSYGNCFLEINPKLFPGGPIQFRARLIYPELYSPTQPWKKGRATLWSNITSEGLVCNRYGDPFWNQEHTPTEGTTVTATAQIELNINITNYVDFPIDRIVVTAFGNTSTFYASSTSMSGNISVISPLDAPRIFSYSPSVSIYSSSNNLLYSTSLIYYHSIYVTPAMGSNPTFHFVDYLPITII